MSNFEKIIFTAVGVLIIVVLIVGVIVFRQQKTINTLAGSATVISNQAAVQSSAQKSGPPLTEVIKQFSGTIENISGNQLTIGVKLPDYSKPKNPEKFKNLTGPINVADDDFEIIDKKITVNTNDKTVFDKKALAELKVGDTVLVFSDKSPYSSSVVTAEKVTSATPK
ncbi:MAG: hypothetical protein NT170_03980 [Candidatus Moranbacteria bacterium]|nr:hypothetical protein [Candidatus Moranbacteria bacterium]